MSHLPPSVIINEDGPREGFQIEARPISTEHKIELIEALAETGLRHIQAVSFVSPKRVPGWADADAVAGALRLRSQTEYEALWFNARGLQRALKYRLVFSLAGTVRVSASEAFMKRNQNVDFAQNILVQHEHITECLHYAIPIETCAVSAAFGCNFQGEIGTNRVLEAIAQCLEIAKVHDLTMRRLRLSDTMAWATPDGIKRMIAAVKDRYPSLHICLHLHDTRGMAVANAFAALEMGVTEFDSSVGGLGGCPFAGHKGAAGNICTEDLVFLCEESGIATGVDLDRLVKVAAMAERIVGHPLPGSVMHGGTLLRFRRRTAA